MSGDDSAPRRVRVAELDAALTRLRGQYDLLMNAFKFDAAKAIAARIDSAERERAALVATLPPSPRDPPPAPFAVMRRPRRR